MPAVAQTPQVQVTAPFARVMPWVLIALGIALAAATLVLRGHTQLTSSVTTAAASTPRAAPPAQIHKHKQTSNSHKHSKSGPTPNASTNSSTASSLAPVSSTTTRQGLSDTLVGSLAAIAAILILLGAFYSRISKFTFAGNSVELTPVADPQEADRIAAAVAPKVMSELRAQGQLGDSISTDQAQDLVEKAAAAAAQTQQQVAQVRHAATALAGGVGATAARASGPQPQVSLDAGELSRLGSGMPFPDDLLSRLADRAVKDKAE
jgi:hypothetical protein